MFLIDLIRAFERPGEVGLIPPEDPLVGLDCLLLSSLIHPFLLPPHWSGLGFLSVLRDATFLKAGPPVTAAVENLLIEVKFLNP